MQGDSYIRALLMLIRIIGDLAFFLVLLRFILIPYRYYGFHPFMEGLLYRLDRICFPVERQLYRLRVPMPISALPVFGLGIALIRGLIYLGVAGNPGLYFTLNPVPASIHEMITLFLSTVLFICLLATIIRRGGLWTYRNIELDIIDRVAGGTFKWVSRLVGYRSKWVTFICTALMLALLNGGAWFLLAAHFYWNTWAMVLIQAGLMLNSVANFYAIFLIIRVMSTWLSGGAMAESAGSQILRACSDPYLEPFRRWFYFLRFQNIDLTPVVGIGLILMAVTWMDAFLQIFEVEYAKGNVTVLLHEENPFPRDAYACDGKPEQWSFSCPAIEGRLPSCLSVPFHDFLPCGFIQGFRLVDQHMGDFIHDGITTAGFGIG